MRLAAQVRDTTILQGSARGAGIMIMYAEVHIPCIVNSMRTAGLSRSATWRQPGRRAQTWRAAGGADGDDGDDDEEAALESNLKGKERRALRALAGALADLVLGGDWSCPEGSAMRSTGGRGRVLP